MQAWPILEPHTPFVDGIHIDAICLHLQAVKDGRIANLLITVPPGHAKSLLTAVFWPAWVWIDHPEARWLFSSYREALAVRDSIKCRRLIQSDWYQERWGSRYQLRGDQNTANRSENTRTGYRVVVPMGAGTGERGDYVVIDDPHSVQQAESETERRRAIEFWNGSMASRLNDLATGHKVVVQQRVHEADLAGDLLQKGGYESLCLMAEFEPERRCSTSINWTDPRTEPGELLWPGKVRRENLEDLKKTLGTYRYAGQYQQRPAPAGGGIFQRHQFRFWRPAHMELPPVEVRLPDGGVAGIEAAPIPAQFDTQIQSWDLAFKDSATSHYVVGQTWGGVKADRFLLDQRRERLDLPGTKRAIREMTAKWPKAGAKLIEDKANGPAVIQELRHDISGLIEVNPEGGKLARAHAVSPQIESGNVYLPHPAIASWVEDFLEEVTTFPNGRHDDQVDAMTQALNRLRGTNSGFYVPESQITVDPFRIPEAWPKGFGMAITPAGVAAVWGARDEGGTIYLYAQHWFAHNEPSQNARAIRQQGDWIPGWVNFAALPGSQGDQNRIARLYRDHRLKLQISRAGQEAGMCQFWQLLARNKLKVFASLSQFLGEYRVADEQSPPFLCCHAMLLNVEAMRTKPAPAPPYREPKYSGERSWMA